MQKRLTYLTLLTVFLFGTILSYGMMQKRFAAYVGENPHSGSTCVFFMFEKGDVKADAQNKEWCRRCNGGQACKYVNDVQAPPACSPICAR